MVIVRLIGGLGNQMFQYAIGKSISMDNNVELKFETSFYDDPNSYKTSVKRKLELDIFDLEVVKASESEIRKLSGRVGLPSLDKVINKVIGVKKTLISENNLAFDTRISSLQFPVLLEGFWQSEKYFAHHREKILQLFSFKKKLNDYSASLLNEIKSSNAVSIHIRRGDFLQAGNNVVCDTEYYNNAVDYIKQHIPEPKFYVFTDDQHWVKDNFKIKEGYTLVNGNTGTESWMDMCLMANCKHNITANSSFSWWGAWLNNNKDKMVITPKKWYTNPKWDESNLVPDQWIKL